MQYLGSTETIEVLQWLSSVGVSQLKVFSNYHTGLPAKFRIPILVAIL